MRDNIAFTLKKNGDSDRNVKLIVVTKTHSAEKVDEAITAGAEFIGENKVQEAAGKLPLLQQKYQEFHFIGHLQSNKIGKLLQLNPALIHSLDKFSTAQKLNTALANLGKTQKVLVQVNTSEEASKSGTSKEDAFALVKKISELRIWRLKG